MFLDVYQGVAPGREDDGVQKLVRSLAEVAGPVTPNVSDPLGR